MCSGQGTFVWCPGGGGWPIFSITFSTAAHKYTSIATRNLIKTDATQSLAYYNIHKVTVTFLNIKVEKERSWSWRATAANIKNSVQRFGHESPASSKVRIILFLKEKLGIFCQVATNSQNLLLVRFLMRPNFRTGRKRIHKREVEEKVILESRKLQPARFHKRFPRDINMDFCKFSRIRILWIFFNC